MTLRTFSFTVTASSAGFTPQPEFSVSGTYASDGAITVTGTGFGAGPTVILFDDHRTGSVGDDAPLAATVGSWSSYNNTNHPKLVSGGRSGSLAARGYNNGSQIRRVAFSAQTEVFASYAFRMAGSYALWPASSHAKWVWWWDVDVEANGIGFDVVTPTHTSATSIDFAGNETASNQTMGGLSVYADPSQWSMVQAWLKPGSPIGVGNATCHLAIANPARTTLYTRTETDKPVFRTGTAHTNQFTNCNVPGLFSNLGADGANFIPYLDDIYLAVGTGTACKRFLLGNASTYAACTELAICTPNSWTDTAVSLTLRTGAWTSVSGLYLYYLNASNAAALVGRFG
jgi:hypothetical protein